MVEAHLNDLEMYPVIIMGGGIPGLVLARDLAESGVRVCLCESSLNPELPNYSTAGVPSETVAEFRLPVASIRSWIRHQVIGAEEREIRKSAKDGHGFAAVLDFGICKKLLVAEACVAGAEVCLGSSVIRADFENADRPGGGVRVTVRGPTREQRVLRAQFVIDASGSSGKIAVQAGLRPPKVQPLSIGMEFEIESRSGAMTRFAETIAVYFDTEWLPHSYGWVFANGPDVYKVGMIEFWCDPKRGLPSLEQRLRTWCEKRLGFVPGAEGYRILEKHGGSKQIGRGFGDMVKGPVIGIGDSIGAIHPFLAEGIRQGLVSARIARHALEAHLLGGQDWIKLERRANLEWRAFKGPRWAISEGLAELLYRRIQPELIRALGDVADAMSSEELRRLVFQYEFEHVLRRAPLAAGLGVLQGLKRWLE